MTAENLNPRWKSIEAQERRVLGVLIEKAKTTPESYPLSLNALKNGSNQKSNRFPQMQLDEDQVGEAIENLREAGALAIIQGDGRVEKYRHLAYEWFGVDKVELAVMGELLLRGAQSVGELRGRAARMEPIKGINELQPILDSLVAKNLILYLTPPGRGAVVTHNVYQQRELDKIRRELGDTSPDDRPSHAAVLSTSSPPQPAPVASRTFEPDLHSGDLLAELRSELADLREQVEQLRVEFDQLSRQLGN